jgi:heme/copper-type cytochrome/quinol oxidase subunit 4
VTIPMTKGIKLDKPAIAIIAVIFTIVIFACAAVALVWMLAAAPITEGW